MPRVFLRRGNTPAVQCPYTMYPEDASAEDTRGSITYKEGQYLTNNVEAAFQDVGDGPIDLSMSGSGKAWLSYQGSSPGNAQGMSDHLTLHEHPGWSTNVVNDGGGINNNSHSDIFAPPSKAKKYPAIPDNYKLYNGGINQVRRSDLMQKSVPNYYTQRFSIDNRMHQSGDTVTQGCSSDESMKSLLLPERANNSLPSLEDIIRVVQDKTGRQPGRSYCMSLLKSYYLDAVWKRDFVRDLLRELHTSCFQEPDFTHSTFRSSRDNRYRGHINAHRSRESIMDDFPAPYAPMETEPNSTFDAMLEDSHDTFLEETFTKAYGPERRINSNYNSATSYGNGDAIRNNLYSEPVANTRQYLSNVCQSSRKVSGQPSQEMNGTIPQPMSIEPRWTSVYVPI
ncbi:uncharacterized protein LOC121420669 [Lytechinus variegatus]|uniref:uncharacterized protein LOC121420669 n=1 Tax=Lytechinus variegatus TaxID=7654 RepID=UPI001BB0F563|nr:uncharacterized protein LOC121420669 [Lytechinus variegatus]